MCLQAAARWWRACEVAAQADQASAARLVLSWSACGLCCAWQGAPTCVRLNIQHLQQLQRVSLAVAHQPVGQHAAPSLGHTAVPVAQQLLQDGRTLQDAAAAKRGGCRRGSQLLNSSCEAQALTGRAAGPYIHRTHLPRAGSGQHQARPTSTQDRMPHLSMAMLSPPSRAATFLRTCVA